MVTSSKRTRQPGTTKTISIPSTFEYVEHWPPQSQLFASLMKRTTNATSSATSATASCHGFTPRWYPALGVASRRIAVALVLVALTGCGGGEDGASSPEDAVTRFLAALSEAPETKGSGEASPELEAYWGDLCDVIDPDLRPAWKFDDRKSGAASRTECGGTVALAVGESELRDQHRKMLQRAERP